MKNLIFAFKTVFKDPLYLFLAISLTFNLLAIYYFLFLKSTTLIVFFDSNIALYNWLSIILTFFIALSFGIAVTFLIWQWRSKIASHPSHLGNNVISAFLGALSIGCPVCGAFLLSLLGVAGGLFIFPFQGLEIKAVSLILLTFSLFNSAKSITAKKCSVPGESLGAVKEEVIFGREGGKLFFNISRKTIFPLLPAFLGFFLLFLIAYLPLIANELDFGFNFQRTFQADIGGGVDSTEELFEDAQGIFNKINPPDGFTIKAVYGDVGQNLLSSGAIDFGKMKELYEKAGIPLTDEQIKILTQGSNEKIKITPENSYFLLNFLWALGLANKNPILDEGPMMKYGKDKIGNFASTGGWTLGTKKATELYSKFEIIKLTPEQQKILEDFAFNSYRPCCSNPTGFPDCNHGMAALALGELMASQGASVEEIFEAFKYVNAFWFPQTYFDVAKYFQAKEGKDWAEVSGREVAGKDYSTPQGWQRVRGWLKSNNLLEEAPSDGGGCGV